jgi:hypothetical protein
MQQEIKVFNFPHSHVIWLVYAARMGSKQC